MSSYESVINLNYLISKDCLIINKINLQTVSIAPPLPGSNNVHSIISSTLAINVNLPQEEGAIAVITLSE